VQFFHRQLAGGDSTKHYAPTLGAKITRKKSFRTH
jgi:hypothetical protein